MAATPFEIGEKGQIVESRGVDRELRPSVSGIRSPLEFTTTSSVDPGEYLLRLAASDGSRVGSEERTVSARLGEAGAVKLSDLGAGGPLQVTNPLRRHSRGRWPLGICMHSSKRTGANGAEDDGAVRSRAARRGIPASPAPAPGEMFLPVGELAGRLARPAASSVEDDRAAAWRRADTLAANRQLGAARDLLEESLEKWPDATQLLKPLALVYATFGRSTDAVEMLQRDPRRSPRRR